MPLIQFILIVFLGILGEKGFSVTLDGGSLVGGMVQPTSSYYHLVYGAYAGVALDSKAVILRGYYFERPKFESNGFIDQEYGGFAVIGTKLNKSKKYSLLAFAGMGRVSGYISSEEPLPGVTASSLRRYSLPGPAFSIQLEKVINRFEFSISHISFIGKGEQDELDARVAWPFNFLMLEVGYSL